MTGSTLLLSLLALELTAPLPRQPMEVPQGSWVVVAAERDPDLGGNLPERIIVEFQEKQVRMFTKEGKTLSTFELKTSPMKKPREMMLTTDIGNKKYLLHAIYLLEKDRLVICLANALGDAPLNESDRPTEFKAGKHRELLTLEPKRNNE